MIIGGQHEADLLFKFIFLKWHHSFYPFRVIFNIVECQQDQLVPVLTFIIVAINSRSITSLSVFWQKDKTIWLHHITETGKCPFLCLEDIRKLNVHSFTFFISLENVFNHLCVAFAVQVPMNEPLPCRQYHISCCNVQLSELLL